MEEVIWGNLIPREKQELVVAIQQDEIFWLNEKHVQIKEEEQELPKHRGLLRPIGYIGPYPRVDAAVLVNTEFCEKFPYFAEQQERLRKIYLQVKQSLNK